MSLGGARECQAPKETSLRQVTGETRHSHSNPRSFLQKVTSFVSPKDRIKEKGKGIWRLTQICYRTTEFLSKTCGLSGLFLAYSSSQSYKGDNHTCCRIGAERRITQVFVLCFGAKIWATNGGD